MKLTHAQIKDAVEHFKEVVIKHPHLQLAMDELLFLLDLSPNVSIVNLVGPTGIGKSLLLTRIVEAVHTQYLDVMTADPDFMPIICTNAVASGHRLFDWKSLYRGALVAAGDRFAAVRNARHRKGEAPVLQFLQAGESQTAAEHRARLEEEFRLRRTRIWIIDEAQHAIFGGKSGHPGDQFDVMKSIAQNTGVKIVLAGPHEMEPALGTSGQLARRSSTVHFRRYLDDDPAHMKVFASVARTLLAHMRLKGIPALEKDVLALLYTGSAGCIGILKDWLAKAYGRALRTQDADTSAVLTLDHLRSTRLPARAMATIMADIHAEEEAARDGASDADYARIVLTPTAQAEPIRGPKARPQRGRVGTRRPGRDPVPSPRPAAGEAQ